LPNIKGIRKVDDIFRRNALHLYKLNVTNGSINNGTTIAGGGVSSTSVEEGICSKSIF
jgi:hypothetical protein